MRSNLRPGERRAYRGRAAQVETNRLFNVVIADHAKDREGKPALSASTMLLSDAGGAAGSPAVE